MGAFGVIIGILHYMGLYIQLNAAFKTVGHGEIDNHVSGNALFTEVPHDITTQSGADVEMACSFRGAGSPSYSLEIQWWYMRNHRDWPEKPAWTTNEVVPQEQMSKDATKISVVKVAGSNISHKLRLSNVKPADEGTYECRVIDFSGAVAQHHRVRAFLQVEPERKSGQQVAAAAAAGDRHHGMEEEEEEEEQPQEPAGHRAAPQAHRRHQTDGTRELKRRSASTDGTDCTESCVL